MTDQPVVPPAHPGRLATARRVATPIWETTLRDPIRDGHLRLTGLAPAQRQLAKAGLVAILLLLVSSLLGDVWRRGELLPLAFSLEPTFVPLGLMPVTMVALSVAWALLVCGAIVASPVVDLTVALVFGLTGAMFLAPTAVTAEDRWILDHGATVVEVAYYVVLGTLAVSAATHWFPRVDRVAAIVLQVVATVGVVAFFMTQLWIDVVSEHEGYESTIPSLIGGALAELDLLMLPLVFVAAVSVVKFALDFATSVGAGSDELSIGWLRAALLGLVAVKLWFVLFAHWGDWVTTLSDRGPTLIRTLLSLALLVGLVWLVSRFRPTDRTQDASERLIYGSSVVLAIGGLVTALVVCVGITYLTIFDADEMPRFVDTFPDDTIGDWAPMVLAGLAVLLGLWLRWRTAGRIIGPRAEYAAEIGSGLVVVGGWALAGLLVTYLSLPVGFDNELFDLTVTVGVLVAVLVWWRRWERKGLATLVMILVCSWMVMSRGDYIGVLGSLVGAPAILVTVFGIGYVLLSDSTFAALSTKRLPQAARVLLFLGYLAFSVTILHWNTTSHGPDSESSYDAGFFAIGIPLAAWLLGRHLLSRTDELIDDDLADDHLVPDRDQAAAALR
jgi:hypothetical protein